MVSSKVNMDRGVDGLMVGHTSIIPRSLSHAGNQNLQTYFMGILIIKIWIRSRDKET